MYARAVDDRTLSFGVSGILRYGVLVMYDRETGTLWSQMDSAAYQGPLMGMELEIVPALQTTWRVWRQQHPETTVLSKRQSPYGAMRGGYDAKGFRQYYDELFDEGYYGTFDDYRSRNQDQRPQRIADALPELELILGLRVGSVAKAYPTAVLREELLVEDTVAQTPVLVVFDGKSGTSVVYLRRLGGRTLTFELAGGGSSVPLLRDRETGSQWDGLSGVAVAGALQGEQLERIPTTLSFWYGWSSYFSDTTIYWGQP